MKGKQGISIYLMQVLFALVPLIIGAVALTLMSVGQLSGNMEEEVYERLEVAAIGAANYFEYDIQNGIIAQDDDSFAYVDSFAGNEVDITIFQGDVRFITSIKNADGSRNIGTTSAPEIWSACQSGKTVEKERQWRRTMLISAEINSMYFICRFMMQTEMCGACLLPGNLWRL